MTSFVRRVPMEYNGYAVTKIGHEFGDVMVITESIRVAYKLRMIRNLIVHDITKGMIV